MPKFVTKKSDGTKIVIHSQDELLSALSAGDINSAQAKQGLEIFNPKTNGHADDFDLHCKVAENSGWLSVYYSDRARYPVSIPYEGMLAILEKADEVRTFIEANKKVMDAKMAANKEAKKALNTR